MSTLSPDTHPDMEAIQIELLREASVAQRFARVRSLSQTTIELSRRAIRRRHPELDEVGVGLLFVELHYGADLAARVAADLARRRR